MLALLTIVGLLFVHHGTSLTPGGGPFEETKLFDVPGGGNYFRNYVGFCKFAKEEHRKCNAALNLEKAYVEEPEVGLRTGNWAVQYNLMGNLRTSQLEGNSEERVVTFQHLPSTVYVKSFELVSEEPEDVLFHHVALVFCTNLGEGVTVNQDSVIEKDGNERKACKNLISPFGEAWGTPIHLDTSKARKVFTLPDNVGLMVGPKSNYKFAGISIHYTPRNPILRNSILNSGISVTVTDQPPQYYMGMIYANTYFNIPRNELVSTIPGGYKDYTIGTSCVPTDSEPLYLFAYALHTHVHGTRAQVYIHSPESNVTRQIVYDGTPSKLNAVSKFPEVVVLNPGEVVISTCSFDTSRTGDIKLGGTVKTEMCDFLLNFYRSSEDKNDHVIECSDNIVTSPAQWKAIQEIKDSLVFQ